MENQIPTSSSSPKLPGPLQLLKDSWLIYRLRFKTFILILAVSLFIYFAFILIFLLTTLVFAFPIYMGISNSFFENTLTVAFNIPLLFIGLWTFLAFASSVVFYKEGIGAEESFRRSLNKVIPFFFLSVISSLVIAGGLILLIIPGIISFIWFFPSMFILLSENTGGISALLKGKEYAKGYFGQIAGKLLFLIALIIVLTIFYFVVNGIFTSLNLSIISAVIFSYLLILLGPVFFIYTFLLYENLKAIKGTFVFQASASNKLIIWGFALIPLIIIPLILTLY